MMCGGPLNIPVFDYVIKQTVNSYSASHDNWCTAWDTLKQGNHSTVRGDGGSRVGEVRAGTTSTMPEHKGFMLQ